MSMSSVSNMEAAVVDEKEDSGWIVASGPGVDGAASVSAMVGQISTDVPLIMMSAYQFNKIEREHLPQLPSHKLQYSVWHELRSSTLQGDELKAPRVREGPGIKEKLFHRVRDDDYQLLHHSKSGKERLQHRSSMENWENTEVASLPYQDLSHEYQRNNFHRILKRLFRVMQLNLAHNELTDLNSLSFPRCEHLNLNHNYLSSFKNLPKLASIRCLTLEFNDIDSVKCLDRLRNTPLESLNLYGNPVTFTANYRQRIFQSLPSLKVLDSVPKLDCDDVWDDEEHTDPGAKSCLIS